MQHELKIYPNFFNAIASGKKLFEIRKNDRDFQVGDVILLRERDRIKYSGRSLLVRITYKLDDEFIGLAPGYTALGIQIIGDSMPRRNKGNRYICRHCGSIVKIGHNFCHECGYRLLWDSLEDQEE